ncbi:MAG: type II CRISPR RNA-guided endonuclease Cas9, partial [Azoarcus sp.]|nr:type II CRISPR RNA-guided endonuclease Cas9 [Azoarcus sp.]
TTTHPWGKVLAQASRGNCPACSCARKQAKHHSALDDTLKAHVADTIFAQKPVFWRKSTLGNCPLMPGQELCPKGAWLSQQRRMLEKLNNLEIASGNRRPIDDEERTAILARLQTQGSMTWAGVRGALKPLYAARGEKGLEARIRFNLELGGDAKLIGNPLEAKLADIFGDEWPEHPHRQAIRDAVHQRLWAADYGQVGEQRIVIQREAVRRKRREEAAEGFVTDFGATAEQAAALGAIKFPQGWEPYSIKALQAILPELERGAKFGSLTMSPEYAEWRNDTFPERDQPTGEFFDRLPSPSHRRIGGRENFAGKEEQRRLATLRNPSVARTQNELRKVVNNLIDAFGRPDLIRIEMARDVGLSKREREEKQAGMRKNAKRRGEAKKDLESKGFMEPSGRDIEKWMLWKESMERCPYTGDQIGFDALFRTGDFEVEHVWPRSRSLDDSQRNKTLCRKDINAAKGNRTPFEYFRGNPNEWAAVKDRLDKMTSSKGGPGFPRGKVKRFLAEEMPDDFASRQLNDTSYAARQAVAMLKRLWPDVGPEAPVNVQAVTGKVTAQLRKYWGLNNILSADGEKTRSDHRHHAVDALVVACTHPGITQRLSTY